MGTPLVRLPTFADDGTPGQRVDPGVGAQGTGYANDTNLDAPRLNWLLNAIGQWIEFGSRGMDSLRRNIVDLPFLAATVSPPAANDYTGASALASDGAAQRTIVAAIEENSAAGRQLFWRSRSDGEQWIAASPGVVSSGSLNKAYDLAYGAGVFVAPCDDGNVYYSSDGGDNWTAVAVAALGASQTVFVEFQNSLFVLSIGDATQSEIWTSPDGIAWTQRFTNGTLFHISRAAFGNSVWFAAGDSAAALDVYSTNNGVTWNTIAKPGAPTANSYVVRYSAAQSTWFYYSIESSLLVARTRADPTSVGAWNSEAISGELADTLLGIQRYVEDLDGSGMLLCLSATGLAVMGLHANPDDPGVEMISHALGVDFTTLARDIRHIGPCALILGFQPGGSTFAKLWRTLRG